MTRQILRNAAELQKTLSNFASPHKIREDKSLTWANFLRPPQSSSRIHNPAKEDQPLDFVSEKPKIRQVKYYFTNGEKNK